MIVFLFVGSDIKHVYIKEVSFCLRIPVRVMIAQINLIEFRVRGYRITARGFMEPHMSGMAEN